jgi:N-acetylglutamate synthase-like GNAT family acetyltransferase
VTRLSIRPLDAGDAGAIEVLLSRAPDSTMMLRSNILRGGFAYEGRPRQAKYFGAFDGGALRGVAALCWNGMVLVHAPRGVEDLFAAVVREAMENGPTITGIGGAQEHLFPVRGMLDLGALPLRLDVDADLFAVDIEAIDIPELFGAPELVLRRPRREDLDVLVDWDIGFEAEALGDHSAGSRRREIERATAEELERGIDNMWLLERDGVLVSRAILGSALPDRVQVGGVWTPPHERGKGYGRTVVALSLGAAAAQGVKRAVLIAHNPQAIRAYKAIGFFKAGGFTLVKFAEPVAPARIWRLLNVAPHCCPIAA